MIKIIITGSNGFLGSNLVRYFSQKSKYRVFSTSQKRSVNPELNDFMQGNLLDPPFVDRLFSTIQPDIVINTVSLVNVDQCEENPELANAITVDTAENIAHASERYGCRLIYISTDHLFDGKKSMYTEEDIPAPVNIYGKTKLLAESRTLKHIADAVIVRTNFFGWSPPGHPPTFGEWMYNNLKEEKPMNLFTDYYFTPIEVTYLAEAIETVIMSDFSGIINIAGSERCSKYEFGMMLAKIAGIDAKTIIPTTVTEKSFKAPRQPDLSLSTMKFNRLYHKKIPGLRQNLERFLETRSGE
jgi:dTDP-4-dehydrorhamnose reductase